MRKRYAGPIPGLLLALVVACGALGAGCKSEPLSRRIDPDVDDSLGGTGIDSGDLRTVTARMAGAILEIPGIAHATQPPTVALEPVKNGTPFVIDTDIFLVRMRGLLNQNCRGRVKFLARERLEAILKERKSKREGAFTTGEEKALLGADYFLTGELLSISKARGGSRSDYILYSFQLIDAEDSSIPWEGQYEVKKEGKRGTLYR
ncbi:MAG: penicillin-binding protein activator LpoB [Planctomycetota bacterium]